MKIPIHKLTKLEINNNSSMLIPKKYNRIKEQKNKNNTIKNIPIMKVNKRNDEFNLPIKTHNNIIKNHQQEACISSKKNVSQINNCTNKNKNVLKCITKNNSNRVINNEKIKIMKKLELKKILSNLKSNKNRKINNKISKENSNNNSSNKNNKSLLNILNINNYIGKVKREDKNNMIKENHGNMNMNAKFFSSRNFKDNQDISYIKVSNHNYQNNTMINRENFNNLDNQNKIIIKREPRVVISSTIPRYNNRVNRIINNENDMNKMNLNNKDNFKNKYNDAIYKTENNCFISDKANDFYCICHN